MDVKGRIVLYSITGCPHCMRAKSTLQELGLPYVDINLESFPQCRAEVKVRTGRSTVPQIFFNNIHVGGEDDLDKLVANKEELARVLDEIKNNAPPGDAPQPPDVSTAVTEVSQDEFTCEKDEYALLVNDLKKSGLIKDHRMGLWTQKQSFKGNQFVEWVMKTKQLDRELAIKMGQSLIDQHFGNQLKNDNTFRDDDTLYRLVEDDDTSAMNGGDTSECQPRPASELGEDLRRLILKIYSAHLSADGKKVAYSAIGSSAEFERYTKLTKELVRVNVSSASREDKLAFFINVYNALVIHGNIVRGPPNNLWQRYKFFNTVRYIIGGQRYSLQDIENGVLRGNKKGLGTFSRPFGKNDPRLKVALEEAEPLIHFALVCGAKSCPPIKTFSANGIMKQLQLAAESFLEGDDGVLINTTKKEIRLSMIFKWYREDFGQNNAEVLEFICKHMSSGEKKDQLQQLLCGGKYRLSHLPYDWSINSK